MRDAIDHAAIFDRVEQAEARVIESENRVMTLIRWLGGGMAFASFAAFSWGVSERAQQIATNNDVALKLGESAARQHEIARRLDEISALIRAESQLTRAQVSRHVGNPGAHNTHGVIDSEAQEVHGGE
jgi:hypothetical protein